MKIQIQINKKFNKIANVEIKLIKKINIHYRMKK